MRIVAFAAGGATADHAVRALGAHHDLVAVIRPRVHPPRSWVRRLRRLRRPRPPDRLGAVIRKTGARVSWARSGHDRKVLQRIAALQPDLICIATFPWIVSQDILSVPRLGAVNVHGSLLPRHRGIDPFFWTYFCDDRRVGVTIHEASPVADAGPILAQEGWDLPRGMNLVPLEAEVGRRAGPLLVRTLAALDGGRVARRPQDDDLVTAAPAAPHGRSVVDFRRWDAERVWHFLAGLVPYFREPLTDGAGAARYRGVMGFQRTSDRPSPGQLRSTGDGWILGCVDGIVTLARERATPGASG